MALITFKTFDNSIDAHILKAKLEGEGVHCYLFDENTIGINPLYANALGGIKLKIDELDLELATAIYESIQKTPYTDEDGIEITCPRCDSSKLETGFNSTDGFGAILSGLASIMLMIFPLYRKSIYKCQECGCEFKR